MDCFGRFAPRNDGSREPGIVGWAKRSVPTINNAQDHGGQRRVFAPCPPLSFANAGGGHASLCPPYGSCYKAFAFRDACRDLGIKHICTKPYTSKTNGKAERFIQTALRECAYSQAYPTSDRRAEELPYWLEQYNWHRAHGGIKFQTPISRLGLTEDNLLRLHI